MKYCCEKCETEFSRKSSYDRHMNRKSPCVEEEKEQFDINKRTCTYCCEIYASVKGVKVHMTTCTKKPTKDDELKQLIVQLNDKLTEQNNKLSEEIKEMKEKMNGQINITNNIQNNIIVTPYGKEDLSFLTLKDYKKIFGKGCYSIPEILKLIHCNDSKPEFKNVYIKNYKDDYILTFDGKDWNVEKKDDILNNMLQSKKYLLESKFEDFQGELPKHAIDMFHKFLERSEDNEVISNIKDEMKNMFYKNRKHVIKDIKKVKPLKMIKNDRIDPIINKTGDNIVIEKKPTKKQNNVKKPDKNIIVK
jgi:hypothetical protein